MLNQCTKVETGWNPNRSSKITTHNKSQYDMFVRSFVYLENCLEKFVLISSSEIKRYTSFQLSSQLAETREFILPEE